MIFLSLFESLPIHVLGPVVYGKNYFATAYACTVRNNFHNHNDYRRCAFISNGVTHVTSLRDFYRVVKYLHVINFWTGSTKVLLNQTTENVP